MLLDKKKLVFLFSTSFQCRQLKNLVFLIGNKNSYETLNVLIRVKLQKKIKKDYYSMSSLGNENITVSISWLRNVLRRQTSSFFFKTCQTCTSLLNIKASPSINRCERGSRGVPVLPGHLRVRRGVDGQGDVESDGPWASTERHLERDGHAVEQGRRTGRESMILY